MEPSYELVTQEIPAKGKGYLVIRQCPPQEVDEVVRRGAGALLEQGASLLYVASSDPNAPLTEGAGIGYRLTYYHDMLGMQRSVFNHPRPAGRLTFAPLTRETGGQWLALYNECFFDVPNSSTYDSGTLEELLTDAYCCGFALLDGAVVGIYELGFKKEHPEIGSIGLSKSARGKGLGRELLLETMGMLAAMGHQACWLQVSTANTGAYALYQSVGFTLERVISRWYQVMAQEDLCAVHTATAVRGK